MGNLAKGKAFKIYIGAVGSGTLVAMVKSVGFTSSSSPSDVTTKDAPDDSTFLAGSSPVTRSLSVQGLYSDDTARTTLQTNHDAVTVDAYYLEFPIMDTATNSTAGTKAFSAIITALDADSGEVSGEMTFSATFQISGAITTVAEAV